MKYNVKVKGTIRGVEIPEGRAPGRPKRRLPRIKELVESEI